MAFNQQYNFRYWPVIVTSISRESGVSAKSVKRSNSLPEEEPLLLLISVSVLNISACSCDCHVLCQIQIRDKHVNIGTRMNAFIFSLQC